VIDTGVQYRHADALTGCACVPGRRRADDIEAPLNWVEEFVFTGVVQFGLRAQRGVLIFFHENGKAVANALDAGLAGQFGHEFRIRRGRKPDADLFDDELDASSG
jgi:hypothetical protein